MPIALLLAAAATLSPSGPWSIHATDDLCRLERPFGEGRHAATLLFQPLLDLPTAELYVTTEDRADLPFTGTFELTVTPGDRHASGRYVSLASGVRGARVTRLTIERTVLDGLRDGDTLQLKARPIAVSLPVDGIDGGRRALADCVEGLKRRWGIDPAVEARIVTRPAGNPGAVFDFAAYPAGALRRNVHGRVVALLSLGADGAVTKCRIVSSAGSELNEATCLTAQHVHFTPARDKDGVALPSTYLLPVRWMLPGRRE